MRVAVINAIISYYQFLGESNEYWVYYYTSKLDHDAAAFGDFFDQQLRAQYLAAYLPQFDKVYQETLVEVKNMLMDSERVRSSDELKRSLSIVASLQANRDNANHVMDLTRSELSLALQIELDEEIVLLKEEAEEANEYPDAGLSFRCANDYMIAVQVILAFLILWLWWERFSSMELPYDLAQIWLVGIVRMIMTIAFILLQVVWCCQCSRPSKIGLFISAGISGSAGITCVAAGIIVLVLVSDAGINYRDVTTWLVVVFVMAFLWFSTTVCIIYLVVNSVVDDEDNNSGISRQSREGLANSGNSLSHRSNPQRRDSSSADNLQAESNSDSDGNITLSSKTTGNANSVNKVAASILPSPRRELDHTQKKEGLEDEKEGV